MNAKQPDRSFASGRTLIDELLARQRELTAVEQFAQFHEKSKGSSRSYRSLIPLTMPLEGEQFAFEVNLDQCTGCKACVTACHALNGLDDGEAWREVGVLVSDDWRKPVRQVVTTACHHCVDPACLNGCPVLAYEKDPVTGIVRHLDDQCIGCQYCVMMCPYDVPKYSAARGIVRKCDLCHQRLTHGEAPACVQACPNEAIRISIVEQAAVERCRVNEADAGRVGEFLAAAPDPAITLPTTRYVSSQPLPEALVPEAGNTRRLEPAHWPLVFMLVATQAAVGALFAGLMLPASAQMSVGIFAIVAFVLGMGASVFHLGQPLKAWRAFLGLRKSWLSREIIVFLCFAPLLAGTMWHWAQESSRTSLFPYFGAAMGAVGVLCSARVYQATQRIFWRRSMERFFASVAHLGFAVALTFAALFAAAPPMWALGLAVSTLLKLGVENGVLRDANMNLTEQSWPRTKEFDAWFLTQTALNLRHRLGLVTRWRVALALLGGMVLPLFGMIRSEDQFVLAASGLFFCVLGEVLERFLFFRAVIPPRMPGIHPS
jgi:formate dehydrogenase iron-sulfur subunit